MTLLEVRFNGSDWVLRPHGSVFAVRSERRREDISAYLQQYLAQREAVVVFYSEDGTELDRLHFTPRK